MCGFAGFLNYNSVDRRSTLEKMSAAIAHRGPDGEGLHLSDELGLAHRRLAIIDIESGGQPMFSSDKRFVTIFNGEIYNYRELREKLKARNSEFLTNSDTEVIAEAIRVWGLEKASLEFRGMFAFAVYDTVESLLYLARDRVGVKPLYFSSNPSGTSAFFFASEQKALLQIPEISRRINPKALSDTLTLGFPVTPDTCWKDISMFPPGSCAVVDRNGTVRMNTYWRWEPNPVRMSLDEALEEAKTVLVDSLRFHVRSDVPLAAFLSGGIDSSLLVSLLCRESILNELDTFNVGFDEEKYDESSDAEHVAGIAGTNHTTLRVSAGDGDPAFFERIVSQYDEPYGDSSCLPTYLISQKMRERVKVVVSGDGGDELFGGYDRFSNVSKIERLRFIPFRKLFAVLAATSLFPAEFSRKVRTALKMSLVSRGEMFALLHTYFSEEEKHLAFSEDFRRYLNQNAPTWRCSERFIPRKPLDPASQLMGMEVGLNLHGDYLRKVDIASSAHGLEVRVPFLDPKVIDFASRVPMNLKIRSTTLKYLLRELARREISDRIADKGKWGFGIPFDSWCGGSMREYLYDLLFSKEADEGIWLLLRREFGDRLWSYFAKPETIPLREISRFQVYQRVFILASIQIWFNKWKPAL